MRWMLRLLLLPLFLGREVWRSLRYRFMHESVIRYGPYRGGAVAVVALYQSGQVRADILGLMLALRRRGIYVIAVNTGRLPDAGARLPVDCYIERPNYGRDFGSYRSGISLSRQVASNPSRLLLLNDSVFYAATGLDRFVDKLVSSSADICSATESYEVLPHQTSFCLSFSHRCLSHAVFARFWRRYLPTDLRPATVLFGEIGLSRVLSRAGLSRDVLVPREAVQQLVTDHPDLVSTRAASAKSGPVERARWCVSGNMTHRAPGALLELGLPLVKLDLPSRAERNDSHLDQVLSRLTPQDSETLGALWLARSQKNGSSARLDRLGALCGLA